MVSQHDLLHLQKSRSTTSVAIILLHMHILPKWGWKTLSTHFIFYKAVTSLYISRNVIQPVFSFEVIKNLKFQKIIWKYLLSSFPSQLFLQELVSSKLNVWSHPKVYSIPDIYKTKKHTGVLRLVQKIKYHRDWTTAFLPREAKKSNLILLNESRVLQLHCPFCSTG